MSLMSRGPVGRAAMAHAAISVALVSGLVGCSEPPPPPALPADPSPTSVRDLTTGPDGADFLYDISVYDWPEGGDEPADLFTWIDGATRFADNNPQAAETAGETASALAAFLADDYPRLADIDNSGQSLSERNPDLVEAYRTALVRYQLAMIGAQDESVRGFAPLDGAESDMSRSSDVFALLFMPGGDAFRARLFGDIASEKASALVSEYVSALAPPYQTTEVGPLLTAAALYGTIAAAVEQADNPDLRGTSAPMVRATVAHAIAQKLLDGDAPAPFPERFVADFGTLYPPETVAEIGGDSALSEYADALGAFLDTQGVIGRDLASFDKRYRDIVR